MQGLQNPCLSPQPCHSYSGDHRQVNYFPCASSSRERKHSFFSVASVGVAICRAMYWLKSYNHSCVSLQAKSVCWFPALKWALCCKEMSYPVFSCPDRRNLPKQGRPAQSIPSSQALRWYCFVGEGVGEKLHGGVDLPQETGFVVGALLGSPVLRSVGILCRAGPWGWDHHARVSMCIESCLSFHAVWHWREVIERWKKQSLWAVMSSSSSWPTMEESSAVHTGLAFELQADSPSFSPLLAQAFQPSGPLAQTRAHHHGRRMDGHEFVLMCEMKTWANVTAYLCLEYAGHSVSYPRLGQVWFMGSRRGELLVL